MSTLQNVIGFFSYFYYIRCRPSVLFWRAKRNTLHPFILIAPLISYYSRRSEKYPLSLLKILEKYIEINPDYVDVRYRYIYALHACKKWPAFWIEVRAFASDPKLMAALDARERAWIEKVIAEQHHGGSDQRA